jgi:hypothetical protein
MDTVGMVVQSTPQQRRRQLRKDCKCNECQEAMSFAVAQRAIDGDEGCPGCGGVDIEPV